MEKNVKECAFYNDKICKSPINKNCKECESIRIEQCYYKQLKRLEQENEELKEKLEKIEKVVQNNIKSKTNDLKIEVHPEHKFLIDILQIIRGESE